MLLVITLLSVATALLLASPVLLTIGRWQVRHPTLALGTWFSAFFGGCLALIAATTVAALTAIGVLHDPGRDGVLATIIAWVCLGGIATILTIVADASQPLVGSVRSQTRQVAPLVISREHRGEFVLARVQERTPLALALRWPEPTIMISTGMEALLTAEELRTVIAHERSHLHARHDWAMRIAELNAACVPAFLPASVALRRATALLIELIADDTAARQAGPAHLANALTKIADATDDPAMSLRATRLTARSWPAAHRRRLPRALRITGA